MWNIYRVAIATAKIARQCGYRLETSHPAGADATLLQLLKLRTGATTVFLLTEKILDL